MTPEQYANLMMVLAVGGGVGTFFGSMIMCACWIYLPGILSELKRSKTGDRK